MMDYGYGYITDWELTQISKNENSNWFIAPPEFSYQFIKMQY